MSLLNRLVRALRRLTAQGLLGVLKIALALYVVGGLFVGPMLLIQGLGSQEVTVEIRVPQRVGVRPPALQDSTLQAGGLRDGVTVFVANPAPALLTVQNPGSAARILRSIGQAVSPVATGLGALTLLVVVSNPGRGWGFSRRNARCLMFIALLIAIGGLGSQLLDHAAAAATIAAAGLAPGTALEAPGVDWSVPIFATLAVAALAAAFRVGARLSEDVEGLV
jgi:hypothetical protein